VSGEFWGADPHTALTWLRENEPIYWDERGKVWGISKYEHIREISVNPDRFSSAGGIRPDVPAVPMMIDMDDPEHRYRRRLVSRGFTPNRVRDQEAKVRAVVDHLIDRICERGECDFVWDLAAWLPLIMIGEALGFAEEDYETLLGWSDDMLTFLGNSDPEKLERAMLAISEYTEYIEKVIAGRREAPGDDLISILVQADINGDQLDPENLIFESLLILIGGDETTRHVISGGCYQLLSNRDQWNQLCDDPTRIPRAVEEMLRWVSPIKNMARTVVRDIEFHGKRLHEGDKVVLLYPSANRDEAVFSDPFRFDINRHPNEHMAFGFGNHFCLGNSLARLELRVMFEQLTARLPDLQLIDENEPTNRPANFVSGYEHLTVKFTPSSPTSYCDSNSETVL
jgi:cytochrome P450 family 142 subfamily A polypeptide 1